MQHPFAEILPPDLADDEQRLMPEPVRSYTASRRRAVACVLSALAGAVSFFAGRRGDAQVSSNPSAATGGGRQTPDEGTGKSVAGYSLYLVVPKSIRSFTTQRRKQLGVDGPYIHGWQSNEQWKNTKGFLAWATAAQAAKLRAANGVLAVHEITPQYKLTSGEPTRSGGKLIVEIVPNGWPVKPAASSYFSVKQLADAWTKKYSTDNTVKFTAGENLVEVNFQRSVVDHEIVDALTANPQVSQLTWAGKPTTKALGEEGGPSTRRRGEEGGDPRPTTLRVGEEGATTLAIGEEGGRPLPRPIPQPQPPVRPRPVTTQAVGEEG